MVKVHLHAVDYHFAVFSLTSFSKLAPLASKEPLIYWLAVDTPIEEGAYTFTA